MGNIGTGEILVVLLMALLVLGPTRLPGAARQIGKAMAEFRRVTSGLQTEMRDAISEFEREVSITEEPPTFPPPVDPPPVDPAPVDPDPAPTPQVDPAPSRANFTPAPVPDPDPDPVTEPTRPEDES